MRRNRPGSIGLTHGWVILIPVACPAAGLGLPGLGMASSLCFLCVLFRRLLPPSCRVLVGFGGLRVQIASVDGLAALPCAGFR